MPPKPITAGAHPLHEFQPEDIRTFTDDSRRGFGRSRAPRQYTRQAFYLDEDEDFDPSKHEVPLTRKLQLQRLELDQNDDRAHVDAGAELGDGEGDMQRTHMPEETEAVIEQFRSDLHDRSLIRNVVNSAKRGSARTTKVVERETMARTQAHNEALVRAKMRETSIPAFERLAAARAVAIAERDRLTNAQRANMAPPPPVENEQILVDSPLLGGPAQPASANRRPGGNRRVDPREQAREEYSRKQSADRQRAQQAYTPPEAQAVTIAELAKMLSLNPYGELPVKLQLGLLELADMRSVVSLLQRLIYQDEFDKKHFNTIEIIESMVAAGAKFVEMSRVKLSARLALALDARHYGAYIVRGDSADLNDVALVGGHEHYVDGETSLILMDFRCVRRNRANNRDETRKRASRALGTELAQQFDDEVQPVNTDLRDYDGEDVDVYDDADDVYDGGNDIKNPENHFIYKVTLVFVEALDVHHANETLTDGTRTKHKENDDDDNDGSTSAPDSHDDAEHSESLDIFALPPPPPPRDADNITEQHNEQMDEYRHDGGVPTKEDDERSKSGDDKSDDDESDIIPSGKMNISPEKARTLVGKWRTNVLVGWLNGNMRPAPLCFRAYHISI